MADAAVHARSTGGSRQSAGGPQELDEKQFSEWVELLSMRTGLFISPERRSFLMSGLRKRMRQTGCQTYSDYYRRLVSGMLPAEEWTLLIDSLTVHETCFFRHAASMACVEEHVLPAAFTTRRSFHALSMGCASGEEAYSIGMLIDDYCSRRHGLTFSVTGTDISLPALKLASEGIYLNRRLEGIPEQYQAAYCARISESRFQIVQELRKKVRFQKLNLRETGSVPFFSVDLAYCQNLLIYYDTDQRNQIVSRMIEFIRPGGLLIVGPGELSGWQHPDMEKVCCDDVHMYRRINQMNNVQD